MNDFAELHAYELRRTHTQPSPVDRRRGETARPGLRRRLHLRSRRVAERLDG